MHKKNGLRSKLLFSLVAGTMAVCASANAMPQGGIIVGGAGSITGGNISQTTQNMFINWNKYNIDKGENVQYSGPNNFNVMNRVVGHDMSKIYGDIKANNNGNVYLVNPNGILIGKGATISAHNFVASTRDVTDVANFVSQGQVNYVTYEPVSNIITRGTIMADHIELKGDSVSLRSDELGNLKSSSIAVEANEVHVGTVNGTDAEVAGIGSKLGIDQAKVQPYKLVTLDEFAVDKVHADGTLAADSKLATGASTIMTDTNNNPIPYITGNYMLAGDDDNSVISAAGLVFGDGSGESLFFAGKLDGLGNTIDGLTLTGTNGWGAGLFLVAITGSKFDNLTFRGSSVSNTVSQNQNSTGTLIGAIANDSKYGNSVKLNNVVVKDGSVKVTGSTISNVGGIIGTSSDMYETVPLLLYNVRNEGTAITTTLVKEATPMLSMAYYPGYYGQINDVGGIIGCVGVGSTIVNAYNSGKVDTNHNGTYVGGIAGEIQSSSASPTRIGGIENYGAVNGSSNVGGLAGAFLTPYEEYHDISVDHAYNEGAISGDTNVGGLVGGISTIQMNYGPLSLAEEETSAKADKVTFTYAHNAGQVDGDQYVGGIVGQSVPAITVNRSWNNGAIKAGMYAGGIIGNAAASADLSQDYNAGAITYNLALEPTPATPVYLLMGTSSNTESTSTATVTGGLTYAGGLIGYAGEIQNNNFGLLSASAAETGSTTSGTHLNITDSYNTGNIGDGVGAVDNVYGGLVGATNVNATTITRSFNTGKLTITTSGGEPVDMVSSLSYNYNPINVPSYALVGGLIGGVYNSDTGTPTTPVYTSLLTPSGSSETSATYSLTLSQSHNLGEIVSPSYDNEDSTSVGGLVGEIHDGVATTITDSDNFKGGYTDSDGKRQLIQSGNDVSSIADANANGLIGYMYNISDARFTNSHNYDDALTDVDYAQLKSNDFKAYESTQDIDYQGKLHDTSVEAGLPTDYPDGGVIWKLYESTAKAQDGSTLYELPLLTAFQTKVEQQAQTVDSGKTYGMGDLRYTVTMPDGQRMTGLTWDTVLALARQRNAVDDHMTDASVNDHNGTLALTAAGTYAGSVFYPHYDSNQHGLNIFTNPLTINKMDVNKPDPATPPTPQVPEPQDDPAQQMGKIFFADGGGKIDSDIHVAPFVLIDSGGFNKDYTPTVLAAAPAGTTDSTGSNEKKEDEQNG